MYYLASRMAECSSDHCKSNLWQFKCEKCPGKYKGQECKYWAKKVKGDSPRSRCNSCNELKEAIPRGEEEGVLICFFICSCGRKFIVKCEMQDTAPCYECGEEEVEPCHFTPRRKIVQKTNKKHGCSKCRNQRKCPNTKRRVNI